MISGNLSVLGAIMVAFPYDLIKKQMQVRGDYNIKTYKLVGVYKIHMEKSRISWIL